jgi:hypothetical protein
MLREIREPGGVLAEAVSAQGMVIQGRDRSPPVAPPRIRAAALGDRNIGPEFTEEDR